MAGGGGLLFVGANDARVAEDERLLHDWTSGLDAADRLKIAGGVLVGIGGAAAIAGIVALVLPARRGEGHARLRLVPTGLGRLATGEF